jgi:hypothetical protein
MTIGLSPVLLISGWIRITHGSAGIVMLYGSSRFFSDPFSRQGELEEAIFIAITREQDLSQEHNTPEKEGQPE